MATVASYVPKANCGTKAYLAVLAKKGAIVLDSVSDYRNTTIQFWADGKKINLEMNSDVRSFLNLAVAVYSGDESVSRKLGEERWSRSFRLHIPVSQPTAWQRFAGDITDTLWFLSQDKFDFTFHKCISSPPEIQRRAKLPMRPFDAVCLFSGGIDSLLGAYELLTQGKRLVLVGHQAEPVTSAAQKALAAALQSKFPGQTTLVQCRVARSRISAPLFALPKKCEDTHRPRSFLFLAIAVAVARGLDLHEIYMPENGLIALNPPLQISRVGSHSTRTAHPIFLTRLSTALKNGRIFDGRISNPFLFASKTDMLRNVDAWLGPHMRRSVSCSHPSRYQDEGVRHCGYCVPCIYRRAAMMPPGLDRSSDYAFDVFRNRGSLVKKRALTRYAEGDVRAVAAFATRVVASSDAERELLVLSHGFFDPSVAESLGHDPVTDYSGWTEMLVRWANDFLSQVPKHSTRDRIRLLGMPVIGAKKP